MNDLDRLIAALPPRPDVEALLREFVPPARFADKHFDNYAPAHPTQTAARDRLQALGVEMNRPVRRRGLLVRLSGGGRRPAQGRGVYLDGGFGVGKTHLLAALWHAAPAPKAYLSFDELVHFIGLVGIEAARQAFAAQRLVAIDEWELDDPGNLKLALAFLRGAVAEGVHIAATSNTLPLELGAGRFSQKDFMAEVEELASAFEVVRVEGSDYRHRHFTSNPGSGYFISAPALAEVAGMARAGTLYVDFGDLLEGLAKVHPIRYGALVQSMEMLLVRGVSPISSLTDALRWVHFIDTLYDSAVPLRASSHTPLSGLFQPSALLGPYGKKLSRCLSRMEEMLGEGASEAAPVRKRA